MKACGSTDLAAARNTPAGRQLDYGTSRWAFVPHQQRDRVDNGKNIAPHSGERVNRDTDRQKHSAGWPHLDRARPDLHLTNDA